MGQEPNIPLGVEDLPRATAKPGAPRRWVPSRPGEIGSPAEMPWGGAFGTPAPDTGFAIKIVRNAQLPGDDAARPDVERAVLAVMTARASAVGRAPTARDVEVAVDLLGLATESAMAGIKGVARDQGRIDALVAAIPHDALTRT